MIERYSREPMRSIFSDENRFKAYLEVELFATEAWSKLGVVPENDVKKLLKSLREDEEYHSDLYYNKNTNEISDYEYDKLKRKILEIEEKYPEFVDKNGVRNRVGGRKSL